MKIDLKLVLNEGEAQKEDMLSMLVSIKMALSVFNVGNNVQTEYVELSDTETEYRLFGELTKDEQEQITSLFNTNGKKGLISDIDQLLVDFPI